MVMRFIDNPLRGRVSHEEGGPCTLLRDEVPGAFASVGSGQGDPVAPAGTRLRLLPSGPDLVHGPTSRGTLTISAVGCGLTPRPRPSRGDSASLERIASDRAPLPPRLARSTRQPRATREGRADGPPLSPLLSTAAESRVPGFEKYLAVSANSGPFSVGRGDPVGGLLCGCHRTLAGRRRRPCTPRDRRAGFPQSSRR